MRIALLSAHSYENPTMREVLGGLAREYHRRGHRVVVATRRDARDLPYRERHAWGDLYRLGLGRGAPRILDDGAAFVALTRIFRDFRPQTAHWHCTGTWGLPMTVFGAACRLFKVEICLTFQDYQNPSRRGNNLWGRWRLERLMARCASVTALSRASADDLRRDYTALGPRLRVIPNGIRLPAPGVAGGAPGERGVPPPLITGSDPPAQEAAAPSRRRLFILTVARLIGYKGIDVLLMAFRDVALRDPNLDLVVCGPDHQEGHYQRLAKALGLEDRVLFVGEQSPSQVRDWMRQCLFYALPSRHESFGISVLEAMSLGKAVVASGIGGLADLVEHGVTGLLVPPRDVEALGRALLRLRDDEDLRRRLGANASQKAAAFCWDRAASEYLKTFGLPAVRAFSKVLVEVS